MRRELVSTVSMRGELLSTVSVKSKLLPAVVYAAYHQIDQGQDDHHGTDSAEDVENQVVNDTKILQPHLGC